MNYYQAPLEHMRFILHEVLDISSHCLAINKPEVNEELVNAVLNEGSRFASDVVAPLNRSGDEQGARQEGQRVTTPDGFQAAYRQYREAGWASMTGPEDFDGQGLPLALAGAFHEMLMGANLAFRIYSGLTEGAVLALNKHGSADLKSTYLSKLVSGEWAGTMCLTEPQAGTDLALIRTRANPDVDNRYLINGTKIFISGGDQDLTDNIIHLVLARLPDAPAGVKGISLFLVPKFLPDREGNATQPNALSCGSLEHKMGIKGAATCVMNFDGATGWLVGHAHQGLAAMFTMMNDARFQVGLQGLGIAEMAYQSSVRYACERLQSRALSGAKAPTKAADPIIVHGDVRRMLLVQKSLVQGCRLLAYDAAMLLDIAHYGGDAGTRNAAGARAALLIPIVKAFCTDMSMEVSNMGVQIYGGHGYIREWGMEQLVRDGRITQLYEGTNGIQALDFLRRKVVADNGTTLDALLNDIQAFCQTTAPAPELAAMLDPLRDQLGLWRDTTQHLINRAQHDSEWLGCAAYDYLQFASYILLGYGWARMTASALHAKGSGTREFYRAQIDTARFYFQQVLPRAKLHYQLLQGQSDTFFAMDKDQF